MITSQPYSPTQRHSLHSKAKALSVILGNEFGAPFSFFDPVSGGEVLTSNVGPETRREYEIGFLRRVAEEGQCRVYGLDDTNNLLTLVIFEGNRAVLVAYGILKSLVGAGPERPREQEQLRKWLQAFSDRLRGNDLYVSQRRAAEEQAAQLKRAWELILGLDSIMHHVRIYRDVEKNQRHLLRLVRTFLEAQCVIWVPQKEGASPVFEGDPGVAQADCRQLAELLARHAGTDGRKPVLWNADAASIWSTRFPQIRNMLAFAITDQGGCGWLIALNKQLPGDTASPKQSGAEGASFRRMDAAALAPFAALLELQVRGSRRYQELKGLLVGLTRSLTAALDAKDTYTFGHSERVGRIAMELGQELGLHEDELSDIYLAGLLHDIGKIGIPDALLCKPGPLDAAEMECLKQHVTIGYHILADLHPLRNILPGVLHHHERYDGAGYPDRLAGEQIPMLARILAVADSYDAMSTKRAYRNALEPQEVEAILMKGADSQWDRRVIEAFHNCRERIHLIRQRGVGQSLCQALDAALRTGDSTPNPSLLVPQGTPL